VTETVIERAGPGPRPTLALIGAGRAGSAVAVAAHRAGYQVVAVHSRRPDSARTLAAPLGSAVMPTAAAAAKSAELTLLAVPDAQVTRVAATIAATGVALGGAGVVHLSASRDVEAIAALRATAAQVGALHPLQALTGPESAAALRGSGFAVAADAGLEPILVRLVADLGGNLLPIGGVDRRLYHAAAVLAGNAPLALLAAAAQLLAAAGMDHTTAERALAGLLAGAAGNARRLGSRSALTGPVMRGDTATVAGHLDALRDHPNAAALYRNLSLEMLRLVGPEGREAIAGLLTTPEPPAAATSGRHRAA